jgi:hypothetical protein
MYQRFKLLMILLIGASALLATDASSRTTAGEPIPTAIVEETVQGRIAFVAPELGQLTITSGDRRLTIQVGPETRIRLSENREGTLADLRTGWNVLCVYTVTNQRNQALVVLVLST